jgi:hypothetical protein
MRKLRIIYLAPLSQVYIDPFILKDPKNAYLARPKMPPITKFWLCTLKDPESINAPEFQHLITELLEFCSSWTNPEPDAPPMHAFYQDTVDSARLVMMTGYQSQELNTEADKVYAERYSHRMFEFVQHKVLRQIDVDIHTLPIAEHVSMAYGKNPEQWREEDQAGGWDVWPQTRQATNDNGARGEKEIAMEEDERFWVQVSKWNGGDSVLDSVQPVEGERLFLKKIASR